MEYRKIIKFGKNSHVISIPKTWLDKNKLKKGDIVYLDESNAGLVVSPKEIQEEKKEITIDITDKDEDEIRRRIDSSYLNNYTAVKLVGKNLNDNTKLIKNTLHNLVGLEILEQTPASIIAKDFLNLKEISIEEVIRKIDIIIRSMFCDAKNSVKEDLVDSIAERDDDINRLTFLLQRTTKNALKKPSMSKILNIDQKRLLNLLSNSIYLEMIADEIKRSARLMYKIKLKEDAIKQIIGLILKIEKLYLTYMKAYYNKNEELAYSLSNEKKSLMKECDEFYERYYKNKETAIIMEKFKNMIYAIHEFGRSVYQ